MSYLDAPDCNSRLPRYVRGIDRWEFGSLSRRAITCAYSNAITVAVDETWTVWWWGSDRIWSTLGSPVEEEELLRQNAFYIARLRRAVPIVWLYLRATYSGEKDAAYSALARLAQSVTAELRGSDKDNIIRISVSSLYSDIASDGEESCRWQIADLDLPVFDPRIREELQIRDKPASEAEAVAFLIRSGFTDAAETLSAHIGSNASRIELD